MVICAWDPGERSRNCRRIYNSIHRQPSIWEECLQTAIADGYKRLLLPALEALGTGKGVRVELDLAAYYSSVRAYDVGSIEVGVHHADTDNVQVIRTPELKDGKWHHCSFTFADADSASQVLVRSNSTRFYVDNICVKAL